MGFGGGCQKHVFSFMAALGREFTCRCKRGRCRPKASPDHGLMKAAAFLATIACAALACIAVPSSAPSTPTQSLAARLARLELARSNCLKKRLSRSHEDCAAPADPQLSLRGGCCEEGQCAAHLRWQDVVSGEARRSTSPFGAVHDADSAEGEDGELLASYVYEVSMHV